MFRSLCILTTTILVFASTSSALVRLGHKHDSTPFWRGEVTPYAGFVDFGGVTPDFLGLEETSGGIFGIEFGFLVSKYLELGFNIADIPTSTVIERSGPYLFSPPLESFVGADIVLTDLDLTYNMAPPGRNVVPFLRAGIGRESVFYDGIYDGGFTTYNLGVGAKALLHHRVFLNMSLRHHRTFQNIRTVDLSGNLSLTQFSLGLSILF